MPGDMSKGDKRIGGCTAACQNGSVGADDGMIGDPNWNMTAFQSASIADAPSTTVAGETVLFWYELAKAEFLVGVTEDGIQNVPARFGGSLPAARIGGGFLVGFSNGLQSGVGRPSAAGNYSIVGNVLALAASPAALTTIKNAQPLTPLEARQIDSKIDDGLPDNGNVQAYGVQGSCYNGSSPPFAYRETVPDKDCGLYFRIGLSIDDGVCGGDNGRLLVLAPTNLCFRGAPSAVNGTGPWSWTCNGTGGSLSVSCSAQRVPPVNGMCGSDHGQRLSTTPTNLCSAGTASTINGTGPWNWTCSGSGGGSNAGCAANRTSVPVNGVCGSDNGQTLVSTPTNLCSAGAASAVNGTGPWSWSCNGSNGGTTASCAATAPPPFCGDGICNNGESHCSCGADCPPPAGCKPKYTRVEIETCPSGATMIWEEDPEPVCCSCTTTCFAKPGGDTNNWDNSGINCHSRTCSDLEESDGWWMYRYCH